MRNAALVILMFSTVAWAAPKKKRPPHHGPVPTTPAPAPTETPSATETPPADAGSGGAPPAAESTPPPAPAPATAPPAPMTTPEPRESVKANVDLDTLNREYNQLRDELFRSRAKAHLLGDALFKTKIVATFQYKAQRAWPIKKVTLKIDDQPVFTADSPSTQDPLKLYDGFAAPGKHTLAVRVDCGATGEDRVAYGAEGTFDVRVRADLETVERTK